MKTSAGRGMTVIELCVTSLLVALVLGVAHNSLLTGRGAAEKGLSHLDRLGKINRLLEHCKRALRFATDVSFEVLPPDRRRYVIRYIRRVELPDLTRVVDSMVLTARQRTVDSRTETTVTVEHQGRKTVYLLKDVEFGFELHKNLATITVASTVGTRPPLALSLYAPFLSSVTDFADMSSSGGPAPGSTASASSSCGPAPGSTASASSSGGPALSASGEFLGQDGWQSAAQTIGEEDMARAGTRDGLPERDDDSRPRNRALEETAQSVPPAPVLSDARGSAVFPRSNDSGFDNPFD